MGIGDWGLGIGEWGLGPIPSNFKLLNEDVTYEEDDDEGGEPNQIFEEKKDDNQNTFVNIEKKPIDINFV